MAASNTQTVAYQFEKVSNKINELFQRDYTLLDRIEKGKNLENISSRAMRIPLDIVQGGKFRQIDPNGGAAGRGSAIQSDYGQITSQYFDIAIEFTKLMEAATDSKEKAVAPAAKRNLTKAIDQFRAGLEALLNTDGSGTLDTVASTSGNNVITVSSNANQFYGNQDIQVFPSLGAASRGKFTVFTVDPNAKQLNLATPFPAGTTAGDLLVVDGAPGLANSSLAGLETYQVDANTGTFLQLPRSSYPGMLKTPHVAGSNAPLTPQMIRLAQAKVRADLGIDTPEIDNMVWHMNQDQEAAWENVGLVVSQVIQNQLGGSASEDMLKRTAPKRMGDREMLVSIHAKPGRIDGLCLKHWGRAETQKIGPLEYGGQTMFPGYAADGGTAFTTLSYIWCGFNVYTDNPRAGAFIDGLALPSGY